MTRLTEGNSQNQALESSCVEVKVLSLALYFSLFFSLFLYVVYMFICLYYVCLVKVYFVFVF